MTYKRTNTIGLRERVVVMLLILGLVVMEVVVEMLLLLIMFMLVEIRLNYKYYNIIPAHTNTCTEQILIK